MAITVSFGTKFQLDLSPKTFEFNDSTDYAGQGVAIADYKGVIKVIDPTGAVHYNNGNYAAPDINPSVSLLNTTTIALPLDSDGKVMAGSYVIRYSVQDTNTLEISFSEVTLNYTYASPTVTVVLTSNCVKPLLKSVDTTNYSIAGVTPTIVRTHTLFYPAVLQEANLVGTGSTLETSTFFTEQHSSEVETDLTYVFPTYTVTDTVTGTATVNVQCDAQLCDIYCCMAAEFARYMSKKNTNTADANMHLQNWIKMMGIATMIRIALECGKESDVNSFVSEILTLGQCKTGCGCESGAPVPVLGLGGLSSANVAVAAGTGITVTANTVGNVTTYTVSIQTAIMDIINNSYNTIVAAGTNITSVVETVAADGTKTYTINAPAPATIDQMALRLKIKYFTNQIATIEIVDSKITGTLFQLPTLVVNGDGGGFGSWSGLNNRFTLNDFLTEEQEFKAVTSMNAYTIKSQFLFLSLSFSSVILPGIATSNIVLLSKTTDSGTVQISIGDDKGMRPTNEKLSGAQFEGFVSLVIHR